MFFYTNSVGCTIYFVIIIYIEDYSFRSIPIPEYFFKGINFSICTLNHDASPTMPRFIFKDVIITRGEERYYHTKYACN